MKRKDPAQKPRNLLHDHPLLRKGGCHGKNEKAERRDAKVKLRREWCPQSALMQSALSTPLAAGVFA